MLAFQQRKYQSLVKLVDAGAYDVALPDLEAHWTAHPNDFEAFSLLEQCYSGKEDWNGYERLLLELASAQARTYRLAYFQIKLSLAKGLPKEAIAILNTGMDAFKRAQLHAYEEEDPGDFINFDDNIPEIGGLFKQFGFEASFIAYLNQLGHTSGCSGPILLAQYYAYVAQNKEMALATIQQALQAFPNDELLGYELALYQEQFIKSQRQSAQAHLSNHKAAQAASLYFSILQEMPKSLVAQEYYLIAVVCKFFPPFLVFFSKHNWIGLLPPVGKAFLQAMFFFVCCFYYKGRNAPIEHDVLENIIWIAAAFSIVRFFLFPFVLQIVAIFKWPSYHLLKRPIRFFQGVLILLAWLHVLWAYGQEPERLSFRLFLTVGFLFHAVVLEFANGQSRINLAIYLVYISTSLSLGTLAYFNIIPETWVGLLFGGWMLPILFNALTDWVQNLKINKTFQDHTIDLELAKNELNSRRIFVASQILLGIAIVFFLATKAIPENWRNFHLFSTFGALLWATVVMVMAEKNEPDLITLSKRYPVFNLLHALMFVGMVSCLYLSSICGNYPLRKGGICVYSLIGNFIFPILAVIVHGFYRWNWKSSKTIF